MLNIFVIMFSRLKYELGDDRQGDILTVLTFLPNSFANIHFFLLNCKKGPFQQNAHQFLLRKTLS